MGFDRLRPPPEGIPILIYHRVGRRTAMGVDLPTELFDEHMAYLAETYEVVDLDETARRLGESDRGKRAVAVTFDDGTADFVDEALPSLERHGIRVTYYLATDYIERAQAFPDDGIPMSWAAVREAVSTGLVDIGSHTHTHALLDRVTPEKAAEELDRSIDLIGDRVGVPARHFAYPKALLGTPAAEAAVRARFRTATLARTRTNRYGPVDLHRLTRSPIQVSDGMEYFVRKAEGGMRLENDLRDVVNRWRYREATS